MPRRALAGLAGAGLALWTAVLPAAEQTSPPALLVSRQLLEAEHLAVGEVVTISRESTGKQARQFRIAGVYEPLPDPMRLGARRHEVRLHLPDLIDLAADPVNPDDREAIDAINIALPDVSHPADASAFERDLNARLPGIVVRSTGADAQRGATFVVLDRFHLAIAIVTVFASSIFLLALMLMLVEERRQTVGILRLVGFRRGRVLLYMFAEGVVLAFAGALVGILLSAAFQSSINRFFQWRYDTALVFVRVTPWIALRSIAMAVPLGILAAVASSWTLLRREVFSVTRR